MIEGMNHFEVLTDDLDGSVDFYLNLLGLTPGPRPDLGLPAYRPNTPTATPNVGPAGKLLGTCVPKPAIASKLQWR